jgi:hypothetical protein
MSLSRATGAACTTATATHPSQRLCRASKRVAVGHVHAHAHAPRRRYYTNLLATVPLLVLTIINGESSEVGLPWLDACTRARALRRALPRCSPITRALSDHTKSAGIMSYCAEWCPIAGISDCNIAGISDCNMVSRVATRCTKRQALPHQECVAHVLEWHSTTQAATARAETGWARCGLCSCFSGRRGRLPGPHS